STVDAGGGCSCSGSFLQQSTDIGAGQQITATSPRTAAHAFVCNCPNRSHGEEDAAVGSRAESQDTDDSHDLASARPEKLQDEDDDDETGTAAEKERENWKDPTTFLTVV
ncbi:unnamed protein product, partial [Amoebophrya sp. A120]